MCVIELCAFDCINQQRDQGATSTHAIEPGNRLAVQGKTLRSVHKKARSNPDKDQLPTAYKNNSVKRLVMCPFLKKM